MADVDAAIQYSLDREDPTRSGRITNTPGDAGGLTRYGLAARWHGKLRVQGFYSSAMPNDVALPLALQAYAEEYTTPMLLAQYSSQAIANHLLSFAVNDGREKGVSLLQGAINALMPGAVKEDGVSGPFTIAAANRCMEVSLLACLRVAEIAFHVSLKQPDFLLGWIRRDLA